MNLKDLVERGLAPSFYTEESLQTVKNGYLFSNETPKEMYKRVAESAAKNCKRPDLEDAFFTIMWKNWLCPSTPVLSNSGLSRGLPISCFGIYTPDSVDGIYKTIHEAAMLTKGGGGIGSYWGKIRARGVPISGNGKSEGIIPWLAVLDRTALAVGQGGVRRAGIQASLEIEHGDIEEFLRIRKPLGDVNRQCLNLHHCVNINDGFMEKVALGDSSARELWIKLLKCRVETGEPYLMFSDNAHKNIPPAMANRKINNTQLCLSGETKVVTKELGAVEIKNLVGKEVTIFDGKDWVKNSAFRKTQENAELFRIHFKQGNYVDATANHRWHIKKNRFQRKGYITEATTTQLKVGCKVEPAYFEYHGNLKLQHAYLKGFLISEGTSDVIKNGKIRRPILRLYSNKVNCFPRLLKDLKNCEFREDLRADAEKTISLKLHKSIKRYEVGGVNNLKGLSKWCKDYKVKLPEYWVSWNKESKIEFLKGIFDGDGTYLSCKSYQLSAINKDRMYQIKDMLMSLGVKSTIGIARKGGLSNFNDGYKDYETKEVYRITIAPYYAYIFSKLVGKFERLSTPIIKPNRECLNFNTITKIEKLEGTYDAYCTTVPTTSKFALANGMMTGNCSEIFLPNDEHHSYVCCLSSLNLFRYDEWKDIKINGMSLVELSIYFLEGIMQEFIEKAEKIPGFEKSVNFSKKARALGLGVLGWHSLLQSKMVPFDSFQSMLLNNQIFKQIDVESLEASKKLAIELGEPEWCKGFGVRHLTRIAIAPTMSNSIISGGHSAGIEPIASNCYSMKSAKGTFIRKNPILVEILKNKHKNTVEVWNEIIKKQGSIQELPYFTSEEKEVFKTAREVNQFSIINQAAQRQKFIDQGQSVNLFFTSQTSTKYINEVHLAAWERGLKSLYYLRSESLLKGGSIEYSKSDCTSCEG